MDMEDVPPLLESELLELLREDPWHVLEFASDIELPRIITVIVTGASLLACSLQPSAAQYDATIAPAEPSRGRSRTFASALGPLTSA